jgi:gamma-glutamylcyclotransferase (GGCT)/AIG2-like uncharacterized protein YtfP
MPLLFSYGTLQDPELQLRTVGRLLGGDRDELVGYEPSVRPPHANVTFNGDDASRVAGTLFEVTEDELALFDAFEAPFDYHRITARLASGKETFVYVSRV